jgi:hypothetical protein
MMSAESSCRDRERPPQGQTQAGQLAAELGLPVTSLRSEITSVESAFLAWDCFDHGA